MFPRTKSEDLAQLSHQGSSDTSWHAKSFTPSLFGTGGGAAKDAFVAAQSMGLQERPASSTQADGEPGRFGSEWQVVEKEDTKEEEWVAVDVEETTVKVKFMKTTSGR